MMTCMLDRSYRRHGIPEVRDEQPDRPQGRGDSELLLPYTTALFYAETPLVERQQERIHEENYQPRLSWSNRLHCFFTNCVRPLISGHTGIVLAWIILCSIAPSVRTSKNTPTRSIVRHIPAEETPRGQMNDLVSTDISEW